MAERLHRALLAALLVLPLPPAAASALAPLERFYAETRTLAGRFTQTVTDASCSCSSSVKKMKNKQRGISCDWISAMGLGS